MSKEILDDLGLFIAGILYGLQRGTSGCQADCQVVRYVIHLPRHSLPSPKIQRSND